MPTSVSTVLLVIGVVLFLAGSGLAAGIALGLALVLEMAVFWAAGSSDE